MKYSNLNYKDILTCEGAPGLVRSYPHTQVLMGLELFNPVTLKNLPKMIKYLLFVKKLALITMAHLVNMQIFIINI